MALGTPCGLLLLESLLSHTVPTPSWIASQLSAGPLIYVYVFTSTLVMMGILGWLAGRKEDQLEKISVTDPLTGLANRRRLRAQMIEELNRADRYDTPLALLLIDLDRLKQINDQWGHQAGDRALQTVAEALRQTCRTTDLPARHGGDEFAVLAVNTTATEALALAQRILTNVSRLGEQVLPADKGRRGPILALSVSVGVSDLERATLPGFEGLHASADQALYHAKDAGRARAVVAAERVRTGAHLRLVPIALPPPSPAAEKRATHS